MRKDSPKLYTGVREPHPSIDRNIAIRLDPANADVAPVAGSSTAPALRLRASFAYPKEAVVGQLPSASGELRCLLTI